MLLVRSHGLADPGDVGVVPRVVVDEDGPVGHFVRKMGGKFKINESLSLPVGHGRDLVPVVPPRHHLRVLGRVHAQPPVGLAEVVENDARS